MAVLFLKCQPQIKDGKEHRYWSVMENRRCGRVQFVQRHHVSAFAESFRIRTKTSLCGTDLFTTMSIWSGFPGRRPLELRKIG